MFCRFSILDQFRFTHHAGQLGRRSQNDKAYLTINHTFGSSDQDYRAFATGQGFLPAGQMPQTDSKRQLYASAASIYSSNPAKKLLATSLLDRMTITPQGQWISPFLDADAAAVSLRMPAHALLQLLHGDSCFITHPAGPAHLNPTSTHISLNPSALLTTTSWGTGAGWTGPGGMSAAAVSPAGPAGEQPASAVTTMAVLTFGSLSVVITFSWSVAMLVAAQRWASGHGLGNKGTARHCHREQWDLGLQRSVVSCCTTSSSWSSFNPVLCEALAEMRGFLARCGARLVLPWVATYISSTGLSCLCC